MVDGLGRRRPGGGFPFSGIVHCSATTLDCWLCDPENISGTRQARDHLFKHCYKWKDQQAVMWARVKEATKRGKQKWRVGDLLADERRSLAVLDLLRSTHVGRTAPPVEGNWDSEEEAEVEEMGDWEEQAE